MPWAIMDPEYALHLYHFVTPMVTNLGVTTRVIHYSSYLASSQLAFYLVITTYIDTDYLDYILNL